MTESDQRRHGRKPVTLVVDYDGADELVADYTENLSSGGIFISTSRELELGREVRLVLSFPGLIDPIPIAGVVRWARSEAEAAAKDEDPGVGIEFTSYEGDVRDRLDDLIARVQSRDPKLVQRLVKVLVVEDNPHVAKLIRDGLKGTGARELGDDVAFNFAMASNGREALDKLTSERFDALIVDIYLPILDGASVIQTVRSDSDIGKLPIIAVSAGGPTAREKALDAGADFFLDKPMRLRQVINTMRKLLAPADD